LSRSFTVGIAEPDDVDLVLQNPEIPELWVAGEEVTVSIEVLNQGTASAGASVLAIYVSDSPTFNPSTAEAIISRRLSALAGQTTTTESFTFPYLESYGDGEKYLFFVADAETEVEETNEDNNITALPINVAPAINIDFTIIDSTAPETAVIGQPITASATVLNQGTTTSAATTLSLYVSNYVTDADQFNIATATFVASVPINALGAGASGVANLSFTYSSIFGSGQKNLFFVVDAANNIEEFREDNNVVKRTILASEPLDIDLVVSSSSLSPTSIIAGNQVNISAQVQNIGTVGAGASMLRVYLSNDQILNEGDVQVLGRSIGAISGNSSSPTQTAFFNYPATFGTGTKYVLFVADANNSVFERNENNNVSAVPLVVNVVQPGIDLVISDASISTETITVGQSITINAEVENQGETASGSTTLGIYLSNTPTLDASAILIDTRGVDSLGTYGSSSQILTFDYLEEYGVGTKYVLIVADSTNAAAESNETNNIQVFTITALPDLDRPDLTILDVVPGTLDLDVGIEVEFSVINQGERDTDQPFSVSFYLANQPVTSLEELGTALFLGEVSIPAGLAVDNDYSEIAGFEKDVDFDGSNPIWSAGAKYLILVADLVDEIAESNETNNIFNTLINLS
jgi:subtilase family serine protease